MPRSFAITAASNSVFLDEDRRGEAGFTVSNQSGREIEGRARLVAEDPEAESWISLRGPAQRSFATAGTEQYAVEIDVPPEASSGNYEVRLDMVGEERPDEQFVEGPTVTFHVRESESKVEPFPWKIVAAIAVIILVGGGVLAYFLPSDNGNGEASVTASFTIDPTEPNVGDEVTLDATRSTVAGATGLTYSWSLSTPGQSEAAVVDARADITSFTADAHGDYEIELTVSTNGASDSETMTVDIAGLLIYARANQSKCIHKRHAGWKNGNPVHLWDCAAGEAAFKSWTYETDTGYIRSAVNPSKCMHKRHAGWKNGNPVHLWDCAAGEVAFKSWTYETNTGYIRSVVNPGKCMHKRENNWNNGNPIHLWDCDAGVEEFKTWNLVVVNEE